MANNEATSVISTQPTSTPPASTVAPAGAAALRTPDKVSQEALGSEVLQRHLPAFLARPAADLLQVNLDVPTTLATVLGVAPRIRTFRGAIAALMPTYDLGLFDNLEEYAIALNDAHATYLTATKPSDELDAAIEEGTELRALLLADATALVHRGLLDSNALGELKGAFGFKNLATDLHLLAKALGAVLDRSAGRSAVTAEELDRATRLQQHIYRLVGLRAQNEPAASAAGEIRQRAFTALLFCYDHVRRGISALRWPEGDADEIAPSLYAGRGTPRKKPEPAAVTTAPVGGGLAGESPGGTTQTTASPDAGTAPKPPTSGVVSASAAGKPGADPFLS